MANKIEPCALLMNDLHVSKDNTHEFIANCNEAIKICVENKIDTIVIGGDLFQSRAAQTLNTLLAVREFLLSTRNNNIKVTIANGNHDLVDQESIYGYGHVFSEYPMVSVVNEFIALKFGKVNLHTMGYFPENGSFQDKLDNLLDSISFADDEVYILYIHEGINGALSTSNEKELAANIFQDFDTVLVGHYHNRCKIQGTNVEYIGSSRQHNFGEDEEKGYTVLYTDGSYKFVKNEVNKRYKTIEINASKINDAFIDKIQMLKEDDRYLVKTKVSCNKAASKMVDKAKLIEAGVSKIELIAEEVEEIKVKSSGLESKFDKSGIKSEYSSFCEKKEKNVELGMKYLDKIS